MSKNKKKFDNVEELKEVIKETIEVKEEKPTYKKQTKAPNWQGKKVISIVDELGYCNNLHCTCKQKDVCGKLQYGEGFKIVDKHRGKNGWFYEVKDGKETYFVTADVNKVVVE